MTPGGLRSHTGGHEGTGGGTRGSVGRPGGRRLERRRLAGLDLDRGAGVVRGHQRCDGSQLRDLRRHPGLAATRQPDRLAVRGRWAAAGRGGQRPPVGDALQQAGASDSTMRLLATLFVYSWPWAIGLCIPLALLLFPDGRPVSRGWWPVIVLVLITAPLFVLEMGAQPLPVEDGGPVAYLTFAAYDRLAPLWFIAELRTIGAYLAGLVALAIRYRRGSEMVRRQLLWLLVAMVAVVAANLAWGLVAGTPIAVLLTIPLIPVAVTVAVVRHRLLDVDFVVSRAVAWLVLSLAVIVSYAVLVAVLDRVIASSLGQSAVATVILVLLAAPVLPRLQRLVDRAVYGDRANAARVVSELGRHLATTEAGLAGVAGSIRQALRLPYVELERDGTVLAADGQKLDDVATLPLTYGGEVVGRLTVGLRAGERRLSEPDRRVVDLVAAPLAVAVHATVVSEELQTSRERLVGAQEEERRRLRRELEPYSFIASSYFIRGTAGISMPFTFLKR